MSVRCIGPGGRCRALVWVRCHLCTDITPSVPANTSVAVYARIAVQRSLSVSLCVTRRKLQTVGVWQEPATVTAVVHVNASQCCRPRTPSAVCTRCTFCRTT